MRHTNTHTYIYTQRYRYLDAAVERGCVHNPEQAVGVLIHDCAVNGRVGVGAVDAREQRRDEACVLIRVLLQIKLLLSAAVRSQHTPTLVRTSKKRK